MTENEKITYMCVTVPNLEKMKRNIPIITPYVDETIIVIGKKDLEAIAYFKSFPNVKVVYREWNDSFAQQYQVGLNEINGGWVLILDDDEVPSEGMLKILRMAIKESKDGSLFDVVSFPTVDIDEHGNLYNAPHSRELFYKWSPVLRYEIDLHQTLVGLVRQAKSTEVYYHYKDAGSSGLRGALRNYWIAGPWADGKESFEYWHKITGQDPRRQPGGPIVPNTEGTAYPLRDGFKTDSWHQLRALMNEHHPEATCFREVLKVISEKRLHSSVVDWAKRNNKDNDPRPHLDEQYDIYTLLKEYGYYNE